MRQAVLLASLGVAAAAYSGARPALTPQGAPSTAATAVRAARVAPPPRCSAIFTPVAALLATDATLLHGTKMPPIPLLRGATTRFGVSEANGARCLLALVAATYGTNYAAVKLLDEWVGHPASAAALRFGVAAAAAVPVLAELGLRSPRYLSGPFARDGLLVGVLFFFGYATQATALETSTAGMQAFLLALSVVVCPILEALIDHKPQPRRVWAAAAIAALGVLMLEGSHIVDGASGGLSTGDVLGLLQPLFFGAGFFQTERAMRRHKDPDDASDMRTPAALTAYNLAAVAVLSAVWMAATGEGGEVAATASAMASAPAEHAAVLGAILWTGLVTTAGCSVAEASALGKLSSADATVVFATEPLWGAAFANAALGEKMGLLSGVGGFLMVCACLVSGMGAEGAAEGAADAPLPPTQPGKPASAPVVAAVAPVVAAAAPVMAAVDSVPPGGL